MFNFLNSFRKQKLNYEQLQMLQTISQQVVFSVEGSVRIPGAQKKALAMSILRDLLRKLEIVAPDSLLDVAIEASVALLKALSKEKTSSPWQESSVVPSFEVPKPTALKLDNISGKPSTGGSQGFEGGLSL